MLLSFLKWAEVQNNIPHFCSHIDSIKILFQILEYIIIRFTYKLALSTICFNFKNQLDQFYSKAWKEPESGISEGILIFNRKYKKITKIICDHSISPVLSDPHNDYSRPCQPTRTRQNTCVRCQNSRLGLVAVALLVAAADKWVAVAGPAAWWGHSSTVLHNTVGKPMAKSSRLQVLSLYRHENSFVYISSIQ